MTPGRAPGDVFRVAVVDDERSIRHLVGVMIERGAGRDRVEVTYGETGFDAIEIRQRTPSPHLMLINGFMPGMHGLEAIRVIRRFEEESGVARVPIIFYSGDTSPELDVERAAGADYVLASPFHLAELAAAVGAVNAQDEPAA